MAQKGSFGDYDPTMHWHGKHISKYKGKPDYYLEYFQKEQIAYLKNVYREFLEAFNYS